MATPVDSNAYYHGVYWNSYPFVVEHLNERAYDSRQGNWYQFIRNERGEPYERGLSVNCGNGWVERDLITAGAVSQLVALDYLDDLLDTAREASAGMPIEFVRADVNDATFPDGPYDLVVNHAAGHHIACVDRVFRRLREVMSSDGSLVTWDYTGPHRNQYTPRIWSAALAVNAQLPPGYRSGMDYPHLATMLASDPTEAIHSELIDEVMLRYFRHRHRRHLGGPIAYLLLTHNERLFNAPAALRDDLVRRIVDADVAHVERFPEDSLFTFAISSPRTDDELDPDLLRAWTRQEELRETAAVHAGGRYYPPTPIAAALQPGVPAAGPPSGPLTPYDVALLGPRFALSVLVRSVAIRFPVLLSPLRRLRRLVGRSAG